MKRNFKALFIATLAFGTTAMISCDPEKTVKVTGIEISPTPDPLVLAVGGAAGKLDVAFTPSDATDKTIDWSVNPEGVVDVAGDGTVTAIAPGTATITATTSTPDLLSSPAGKYISADCDVTVNTVIEDAQIELVTGEDDTADMKMLQVSFATGMPVMDITVPGVTLTATDNGHALSGEGIIPTTVMGGQTVPVGIYTITRFTGTVNGENLSFVLMCGTYPLKYSGSRSGNSGAYTGSLIVSPAVENR